MTDQHVRVGVGAWVQREGKVVLLRRRGSHGSGTWGLPGGHQEWGESPEQTAVREVAEETGLVVTAVQRLSFTNDLMPELGLHYVTLFIGCQVLHGQATVREPDKASALAWWCLRDLHAHSEQLFAPLRTFLQQYPHLTMMSNADTTIREPAYPVV